MRRESFTKEETDALDEGRKWKGRLNKDAAKSKTAGSTSTRRKKKRSRSSEAVDDFTRDINFSLKLTRQDSPRGGDQDCLTSKRHEKRGVGMGKENGGEARRQNE